MGKIITVFGGSGFIGSKLVTLFASRGYNLRVVTKNVNSQIKTGFPPGTVEIINCDISNNFQTDDLIKGSHAVINLVGSFNKTKCNSLKSIHCKSPAEIAKTCYKERVKFVHISAIIDKESIHDSSYAATKNQGECSIMSANPDAIIIKPSMVYGFDAPIVSFLRTMISFFPVVVLPKYAFTKKIQPVYVNDLVQAIFEISIQKGHYGKILDAAGTRSLTLREFCGEVAESMGKKRVFIPAPTFMFKVIAVFAKHIPNSILTPESVKMMKYDSLPRGKSVFNILQIKRSSMKKTIQEMLSFYKLDRYSLNK